MIRPAAFGFNAQTAESNSFQNNISIENTNKKAQLEFDRMVEKMKNQELDVQVFEDLKNDLPDSVFCNNWMIHLPEKKVAVFPMCTPNRRAEVRTDITDWIMEQTETEEFVDLRTALEQNHFLEGTGSIVFDYRNKTAYAAESPRTNITLFEKFCAEIEYTPVSFQSNDLKGGLIYHTN
ncbi:MAG: amidinotransferase, partial [Crocinitomicaceae bacterium]|nr:amidinotransferase [Crocinitomicaceae bacterium]